MTGRLEARIAIVTGAGSGIGRATALAFAREGAKLAAADRDGEAAAETVAAVEAAGGTAAAMTVDVAKAEDVRAMVEDTLARFGRLDVLVNNAGYGFAGTVLDTTEEDWDAIMAVNVKGVFLASKHAIPAMARGGGGAIVNVASTTSKVGIPDRAAYCATKGAVASLTRAMALDHVDAGIRVNAVAPGTIETPYYAGIFAASDDADALRARLEARQAMKRLGTPEEVAGAIVFLASDEASFSTGSLLVVDGGWTAK